MKTQVSRAMKRPMPTGKDTITVEKPYVDRQFLG